MLERCGAHLDCGVSLERRDHVRLLLHGHGPRETYCSHLTQTQNSRMSRGSGDWKPIVSIKFHINFLHRKLPTQNAGGSFSDVSTQILGDQMIVGMTNLESTSRDRSDWFIRTFGIQLKNHEKRFGQASSGRGTWRAPDFCIAPNSKFQQKVVRNFSKWVAIKPDSYSV